MSHDRITIIFDQLLKQPAHVPGASPGQNLPEPDGLHIVEPSQE